MRRLLLLLAVLGWGVPAFAQSTTVSGTIVDAGSQVWFGGTVQFTFRPADSNPTSQYFWNGAPFDKNTTIPAAPLQLDGSGAFSGVSVPSSNFITPSGSTWTVQVCPAATTQCFTKNLSITGSTQSISSAMIPPAVNLNLTVPLLGPRAYTDSEVFGAPPGTDYFNVTDNRLHVCLFSGFPPCTWFVLNGGAGTVTIVSGLTPLFSVTNPTTTPTFVLLNAPAGTIYGNPSGSGGPPSFNPLASFGGIVNSVTGTANEIIASPTTGNVVLSYPAAVIMPGSLTTNDAITSTNGNILAPGGSIQAGLNIVTTGGGFVAPTAGSYTFNGSSRMTVDGGAIHFKLSGGSDAPVIASGVTLSGISTGQCLQTSTGGLVVGIGSPCPNIGPTQIETAVIASPCTPPSSSTYDACNSTVTWPHAFANTSYNVVCTAFGPGYNTGTAGSNNSNFIYVGSVTTTTATIIIQNGRGAPDTPNAVLCIAAHQ